MRSHLLGVSVYLTLREEGRYWWSSQWDHNQENSARIYFSSALRQMVLIALWMILSMAMGPLTIIYFISIAIHGCCFNCSGTPLSHWWCIELWDDCSFAQLRHEHPILVNIHASAFLDQILGSVGVGVRHSVSSLVVTMYHVGCWQWHLATHSSLLFIGGKTISYLPQEKEILVCSVRFQDIECCVCQWARWLKCFPVSDLGRGPGSPLS